MLYSEWLPTYESIIQDMGYSRNEDENAVRVLKAVLMNADLIDDDELGDMIPSDVTVTGGADLDVIPSGFIIATGSSIPMLISAGIVPNIIVTDLDGDVGSQKHASSEGSVTVIHAHGDNVQAILDHASGFSGKVVMTTQSVPDRTVYNFGGFTDGDRAVCMARHFGAKHITLVGFDLDNPSFKEDSDGDIKKKKMEWAKRIIFDGDPKDVELVSM